MALIVGCLGSMRLSAEMRLTVITSSAILLVCSGLEIAGWWYGVSQSAASNSTGPNFVWWMAMGAARQLYPALVPAMLLVTMLRRDVRVLFRRDHR